MSVLDPGSGIFINDPLLLDCYEKHKKGEIKPMELNFFDCLKITLIGIIVYEIKVNTGNLPPDGSKEIEELIELIKFNTEKQKVQQRYMEKYHKEFPSIGETVGKK